MPPDIVLILQTYARTEYALRTVRAARQHLQYDDGEILWYVCDDGSAPEHVDAVSAALDGVKLLGGHSEKLGYGMGSNRAWRTAHAEADLTLWLEDDWELTRPLDLTPYARLLLEHAEVGMVRLGHLAIDLDCRTLGYHGRHYLKLLSTTQYQFSGNPALRHRRFLETYGPYPEGLNPGQTEVAYDAQVRSIPDGPALLWPVDLGGWGVFAHIGDYKSYKDQTPGVKVWQGIQ